MDNLDIDENNYTIYEIINMFSIDDTNINKLETYVIQKRYEHICDTINNNQNMDINNKIYLQNFYKRLRDKLMKHVNKEDNYQNKEDNYQRRNEHLKLFQPYNDQIQQHILNQIQTIFNEYKGTRSTLLVINSKFRKELSTNPNDYQISLPYTFNNVVRMYFKSIEMPNTINSVFSSSLIMAVNETILSIDISNIDAIDDIIDVINTKLTSEYISITIEKSNQHIIIRNTCEEEVKIDFGSNCDFNSSSLGYTLGFRKKVYTINSNSTIQTEAYYDLKRTKNIFVEIDDFQNASALQSMIILTQNNIMSSNVIAKIPIASHPQSSYITYETSTYNIDKYRTYNGPVQINKLRIRLLDDDGNLIQNGNADYVISIDLHSTK